MSRPARLAVIALLILLLIVLWDWNWLRPLVERQASSALGRPVTLEHFDVDIGWHPRLIADGIAIANPEEFPAGSKLGSVERLAIRADPWAWFKGRLHLDEIEIDKPLGDLGPGPSGKPNYLFDALTKQDAPKDGGPLPVDVGRLTIRDGNIRIVENEFKADFTVKIRTEERKDGGEPDLHIDADGRYANAPISARFVGGSVLTLRDPARPYPVDLRIKNGDTEITLIGSVIEPLSFGGADLKLDLRGNNLADLFPLTGVPLPPSPPYRIGGMFDYADGRFRFKDFSGTYGQSDIAGNASVAPAGDRRRKIIIDAHSNKVVWSDLAGLVGGTPGAADAPNDSAAQDAQRKKQQASGKLLPDKPIALPRIRAADLDVTYKVAKIESENTPVDDLEAHLLLEDGLISVKPLKLGVGSGSIAANIELDGRQDLIHTVADVDFRKLDFGRIMQKMSAFHGAGTIGGSARLDTHGNSLADMLGAGNGDLKLFMTGGDISALLVNLAGLDLGNSLISALGLPRRADLRCMVADFDLKDGQVDTRTLLADTSEANIIGHGSVDLRQEKIDYQIKTEPKRLNIGRLGAPINIKGNLRSPSILPDPGALALRGGAAAILGTLLTPLAALIPTIQLGLGEDNDCVALIHGLQDPQAEQALKKAKQPL
ncbi:MAG: AsmA family protein [Hydrocarboniphaga sp.]|uniref:AsmA family protein n=1 Tax=Hydrocarboniphaga sp. TaxID=2033016 RepID=UPI00260749CF|nr:AsmA family protein [Hydrocarboniphaga sp.]MDB5971322.1 AsmA family protein [Hydrocarboniphaga sp.]